MIKKTKTLYEGRKFKVASLEVPKKDGGTAQYDIVEHPGAVVILPMLNVETVILIRNERYSVGKKLWELPAGTLEKDEVPEACAERELKEETGYIARGLERLCTFYSSPGFCNEMLDVFLATDLSLSNPQLDDTEVIEVVPKPLHEAISMIRSGEIMDAKTMSALLYYWTFIS